MFILIEDRAEIRRAQSQLEATLRREFSIKEVRDIGWQGDRLRAAKLHSNGEYWYWSQDHKTTPNPRRLNWFGRINEGPGVGIAVEINIPYEGRNDSVAGFFAKHASSGQIYLFHSGRVGGGAKGVKKDAFVAWSDLQTHPVYARDGSQKEGLLVMPIAARGAALAAVAYVEAIIDFKAAVREGRTETTTAKEKEHQYRAYFDESFGRKGTGLGPRHRLRIQAWRSSEKPERMASTQRPCQESTNRQVRIARSWRIQGNRAGRGL